FIDAASALGSGQPEKLSRVIQELFPGQVIVEVRIFRNVADARAQRNIARVAPQDPGRPRGRENQPEKDFERCALAGAVGPQQTEDFGPFDAQVEPVEGALGPATPEPQTIVFGEPYGLNGEHNRKSCRAGTRHPLANSSGDPRPRSLACPPV